MTPGEAAHLVNMDKNTIAKQIIFCFDYSA
jgi:hypothetical protein